MRSPGRLLIIALALLGSLECLEPAPARLLLAADTVVVNGPASFRLSVTAVSLRGDTLSPRGLSFRADPNGVVDLPALGQARCRRQGDAAVMVSAASVTARLAIRCRPIAAFDMPFLTRLVVGEKPVLPTFLAYDSSGARITEFSGTARIRDSSVVRYEGGMLHPVDIGGTYLDADFGGVTTWVPIQVIRRIANDSLALAAGEIRTWSLPQGRSELLLASDSTDPAAKALRLHVYSANCARGRGRAAEQHWYCIGTAASRAVVIDTRPVGTRGAVRADFQMYAMR